MSIIMPGAPAAPEEMGVQRYKHVAMPPCQARKPCQGMAVLLQAAQASRADKVCAIGETAGETEDAAGLGYLVAGANRVTLFNFCPMCGGEFKFPFNIK